MQTPPIALDALLPYLNPKWRIWECAAGKGNLTNRLRVLGFEVLSTDITDGFDFLHYIPAHPIDMILTNPPYSGRNKENFLRRCYIFHKPFALLMPIDCIGGKERQRLYRTHGIEIIMLGGRLNFETPSGEGSGAWFETAWFTHGLNLPSQLVFSEVLS